MSSKIRLLIVDDHQILVEGLEQNLSLSDQLEIVGTANNGKAALDFVKREAVDVVLMDIDMPVMDGLTTTSKIRHSGKDTKVIILSMHLNANYAKKAFKLGAHGYLLKDSKKEDLERAILRVHNGDQVLDPDIAQRMLLADNPGINHVIPNLTKREREILQCIVNEKTNPEIAKELFISLSTVEFHRKNLLNKFRVKNSIGLVRAALRMGLIN